MHYFYGSGGMFSGWTGGGPGQLLLQPFGEFDEKTDSLPVVIIKADGAAQKFSQAFGGGKTDTGTGNI